MMLKCRVQTERDRKLITLGLSNSRDHLEPILFIMGEAMLLRSSFVYVVSRSSLN